MPSKFKRNNTWWLGKKIVNIADIIGAITKGIKILLETQNNGKIIIPLLVKREGHFDNNKKKPTIINKPVSKKENNLIIASDIRIYIWFNKTKIINNIKNYRW